MKVGDIGTDPFHGSHGKSGTEKFSDSGTEEPMKILLVTFFSPSN